MGNFNRGGRRSGSGFGRGFGARGSFRGGNSRFGGRDGGRPEMHEAVCSECGESCELPFRPSGDRPVFCSSCFDKQGGRNNRSSGFGGDRRERPRFEKRQGHDAICGKCGKECQVPFRPTSDRPVYCEDCFEKGGKASKQNKDTGNLSEQIKALSAKIDRLIEILAPNAKIASKSKPEVSKEAKKTVKAKEPAKEKIEQSEVKKETLSKVALKEKKDKPKKKVSVKKASTKKKK